VERRQRRLDTDLSQALTNDRQQPSVVFRYIFGDLLPLIRVRIAGIPDIA
jgi:hypothetical protein